MLMRALSVVAFLLPMGLMVGRDGVDERRGWFAKPHVNGADHCVGPKAVIVLMSVVEPNLDRRDCEAVFVSPRDVAGDEDRMGSGLAPSLVERKELKNCFHHDTLIAEIARVVVY